ncbi:BaiN/RdsA family NAD(P)/FAD-dependent oxidoreductase [Inconstantimicrobium porci]|uniref:NAD(P)/FAD-dependent oxidoreductase n=1 Tax=Inconstantimicrobium porci TaxID=2652291 RepID=A0A7X2MW65_9CLOT|nr:NAD(P)/FAD-dependent oxidoreductase [Inconstantimicrobium porci]MSR90191.1 NAD(P)/FAD-dependent oxidoreductase [Inconstantimicrobium porci]
MAKVVVIGAGPAGMMASITASKEHDVILLDGNEKVGKKLFITGKGRCNVTNNKDISEFFDYIPGNPFFLYSSLYTFTNIDTMNFFEENGIKLKVERGGRVFPESDKSSDIIKGLEKALHKNGVDIRLKSKVKKVNHRDNKIISVVDSNNNIIKGDYFILCTGGKSYPLTGSTGDGLTFAKKLGHNIVEPKPSLVPVEIKEDWVKRLQGLSLKNVKLSVYENNKKVYDDIGEMIFTHFGISGPLVLSASRHIHDVNQNSYYCELNLKPALDEKELDIRVQKDFKKYINKDFVNSLDDLLPRNMIPEIILLSGVNSHKKVHEITKAERRNLVSVLQHLKMSVEKLRPIEQAIVTAGGVDTNEIDPSTMQSKIINNLYFAGEVIDVDAFTGGYNVQIAFSTGFIAGSKVGK